MNRPTTCRASPGAGMVDVQVARALFTLRSSVGMWLIAAPNARSASFPQVIEGIPHWLAATSTQSERVVALYQQIKQAVAIAGPITTPRAFIISDDEASAKLVHSRLKTAAKEFLRKDFYFAGSGSACRNPGDAARVATIPLKQDGPKAIWAAVIDELFAPTQVLNATPAARGQRPAKRIHTGRPWMSKRPSAVSRRRRWTSTRIPRHFRPHPTPSSISYRMCWIPKNALPSPRNSARPLKLPILKLKLPAHRGLQSSLCWMTAQPNLRRARRPKLSSRNLPRFCPLLRKQSPAAPSPCAPLIWKMGRIKGGLPSGTRSNVPSATSCRTPFCSTPARPCPGPATAASLLTQTGACMSGPSTKTASAGTPSVNGPRNTAIFLRSRAAISSSTANPMSPSTSSFLWKKQKRPPPKATPRPISAASCGRPAKVSFSTGCASCSGTRAAECLSSQSHDSISLPQNRFNAPIKLTRIDDFFTLSGPLDPLERLGEMSERLKEHDWKSCKRDERFEGSNPSLSASSRAAASVQMDSRPVAFLPRVTGDA